MKIIFISLCLLVATVSEGRRSSSSSGSNRHSRNSNSSSSGVRVSSVGDRSLTVTWEYPGRSAIFYWKVQYRREGMPFWLQHVMADAEAREANITGLQPEREYEIRVLAFRRSGGFAASRIITVTTVASTPASSVTQFEVVRVTTSSITMRWRGDDNGRVVRYKLQYRKAPPFWLNKPVVVAGSENSGTVTGLDDNTEYELRVLAFYTDGSISPSETATVTTEEELDTDINGW